MQRWRFETEKPKGLSKPRIDPHHRILRYEMLEDRRLLSISPGYKPAVSSAWFEDLTTDLVADTVACTVDSRTSTDQTQEALAVDETTAPESSAHGDSPAMSESILSESGEICGCIWNDLNGNGEQDSGEPGLEGWTVYLDLNQNGILDTGITNTLEPDHYLEDSALNEVFADITLTTLGASDPTVYAATDTRALTGTKVFANSSNPDHYWEDYSGAQLRIDFVTPVCGLSIDCINVSQQGCGQLDIFDSFGTLLDTYVTGDLSYGQQETMTLTRSAAEIAYAIAGGHDGSIVLLDHLVGPGPTEPFTVTDENGDYCIADLAAGTYTVAEVVPVGWQQTSPEQPHERLFAVQVSEDMATICEFDPATGSIFRSFAAPDDYMQYDYRGLAVGYGSLYYYDSSVLWELNPDSGAVIDSSVIDFGVETQIGDLAYLDGKVYLQSIDSNLIWVWDPNSDMIVTTLEVSATQAVGLAGAADLHVLFSSNAYGEVFKIAPATGEVLATFRPYVGSFDGGLAYVNGELVATGYYDNGIAYRIDPSTGNVLGSIILESSSEYTVLAGDGVLVNSNGIHTVVLVTGQVATGYDFGNGQGNARIEGYSFNDLDGNGIWDHSNEPALAGCIVYLDTDNNGQLGGATVEPDDFATTAVLNDIMPRLTLSARGSEITDSTVLAKTAMFRSTGAKVFGNARSGDGCTTWQDGLRELWIELSSPASTVSLDAICPSYGSIGQLFAYDSAGNLLATYTTSSLTMGEVETMTITRPYADIAQIRATGYYSFAICLDHLVVGGWTDELYTTTDAFGYYYFAGLTPGTYTVREMSQDAWTQTSPVSTERLFAVQQTAGEPMIWELDSQTGDAINSFTAPSTLTGESTYPELALGHNSLFYITGCSTSEFHTLWELDPDTGAVIDSDTIDVGSLCYIRGLAYLNGLVYLQKYNSDELLVWDPVSDTLLTTLDVSVASPRQLTGAADLGVLFGSNAYGEVYKINTVSGFVSPIGLLGFTPRGLAYADGQLLAADYSGTTYHIDPQTGEVLGTFTLANGYNDGLASDGAAVGLSGAHTVFLATNQVAADIDFGNRQTDAQIEGYSFNDLNGNGIWDQPDEPGLPGCTITLCTQTTVEPDDYADGTVLNDAVVDITLSTHGTGITDDQVLAGTSEFTSTGTAGFVSRNSSLITTLWSIDWRELWIDLAVPVSSVSIDAISYHDDDNVAQLQAYDSEGNLLATYTTPEIPSRCYTTMTITRPTADIAQIRAYGTDGSQVGLDHLVVSGRADDLTTITDASGHYMFDELPEGTYSVIEATRTGWQQTCPGRPATERLFAIQQEGDGPATICELDPETGSMTNSFASYGLLTGLAVGPNSLFAYDIGGGARRLWELDLRTGVMIDVDTVPVDLWYYGGVAYLNGYVYLSKRHSSEILVWDPASDTLINTLSVPSASFTGGMAGAADLNVLFASGGNGIVLKIDPETGDVLDTLSPDVGPIDGGLAYVQGELIAANYGSTTTAYRIDPSTGTVLGILELSSGGWTTGLAGDGVSIAGNLTYTIALAAGEAVTGKHFGNQSLGSPEIVFSSNRNGDYDIYMMDLDGSEQTRLTSDPGDEVLAVISPDNGKIAFSRGPASSAHSFSIMDASPTGSVYTTIDGGYAAYSPDGTTIVFSSKLHGGSYYSIYVTNADGTGSPTRLTHEQFGDDLCPTFSPDGTTIVFSSRREGGYGLYIMNVDGTELTRLTFAPSGQSDLEPSFSPDGSQIVFSSNCTGNFDIYAINIDGSGLTQLTNTSGDDICPSFSPDGSRIVFSSNRTGNYDVYLMNADGTEQTQLTYTVFDECYPSFSQNGSSVTQSLPVSDLLATDINENEVTTLSGTITAPSTLGAFTVDIVWGDGTSDSYTDISAGLFSFTHRYLDNAPTGTSYSDIPISVTVTSDSTDEWSGETTVRVTNLAPEITSVTRAPSFGRKDEPIELTVLFTDAGTIDTHTVTIHWGEGTPEEVAVTPGARDLLVSHVYTADGVYSVTVAVSDDDMASDSLSFTITVKSAEVVDRHIFYNNSYFDGNDAGASTADFAAIAPHTAISEAQEPDKELGKDALLPGETATLANYTSYSRGINGIMVDISGMAGTPTADDFTFKVGNDSDPDNWTTAPAPLSVTVWAGAGTDGSDRITIIWADNAIEKQWLRVTVEATAATGLAEADVFYFGNAIADTGDSASNAFVNATDAVGVRDNPHNRVVNPAPVYDAYDFNRDAKVDATDAVLVRNNATNFLTALKLISAPTIENNGQMAEVATELALQTEALAVTDDVDTQVLDVNNAGLSEPVVTEVTTTSNDKQVSDALVRLTPLKEPDDVSTGEHGSFQPSQLLHIASIPVPQQEKTADLTQVSLDRASDTTNLQEEADNKNLTSDLSSNIVPATEPLRISDAAMAWLSDHRSEFSRLWSERLNELDEPDLFEFWSRSSKRDSMEQTIDTFFEEYTPSTALVRRQLRR